MPFIEKEFILSIQRKPLEIPPETGPPPGVSTKDSNPFIALETRAGRERRRRRGGRLKQRVVRVETRRRLVHEPRRKRKHALIRSIV